MTEYLFNKKEVRHLFCRTCGVESFTYGEMPDRSPVATINLNCLEGVDPRALTPMHVDGRQY